MANQLICTICMLSIITAASLTMAASQGGNSTTSKVTSQNKVNLSNASLNLSASVNPILDMNVTEGKEAGMENVTTTSISSGNSTARPQIPNWTYRVIGRGMRSNESAYRMDAPNQSWKNASDLWYVIQAKPHGCL